MHRISSLVSRDKEFVVVRLELLILPSATGAKRERSRADGNRDFSIAARSFFMMNA